MMVGHILRKIRRGHGFSQQEIANKCGLTREMICMIERGNCTGTLNTLKKVADALRTPLWKIIKELEKVNE